MPAPDRFHDTHAAACFLALSPRTLEKYRVAGGGPAFHKFGGRVRYASEDLEAWAEARRRLSTSEPATYAGRRR